MRQNADMLALVSLMLVETPSLPLLPPSLPAMITNLPRVLNY